MCAAQMDFARAYDSVRQAAVRRAMERREVPRPIITMYSRELRGAGIVFRHPALETAGIVPSVGLRQGCSGSPMFFRLCME